MIARSNIFYHALQKYGTKPAYPFHHFPDYAALRHDDDGKWYALVMNVPAKKIGVAGEGDVEILDVKCEPDDVKRWQKDPGVIPAYHMNKEHWISIVLDGSVPADVIWKLLDASFKLTK
jgi:predicted DNA-binding protein (MmcQ/YjbR family)